MMMGSTPEGADWCIKALHPSDPSTRVVGIPDMTTATSCLVNYQVTASLSPTNGATGTWEFDATLLPHPVNFMATQKTDSTGTYPDVVLNTQMMGATIEDKTTWLISNAQQWRLAYAGVTITQDGPALADQGTIVVSQSPISPVVFPVSAALITNNQYSAAPPVEVYTAEDFPNYMASQALPNSYFDQSKKGVYIPLKLTKTCQQWKSQADVVGSGYPSNLQQSGLYEFPRTMTYAWPHWTMPCTYLTNIPNNVAFWDVQSHFTSPMLNDIFAHISARNLAVTTSFAFFFRFGIEMRVHPTSTLAPQLTLAPRYDQRALESYFAISRELKDAYEAKFNDMGKLWGVISTAARSVLPYVAKLGVSGKTAANLGSAVLDTGDLIQSALQRRRQKKKKPNKAPTQGRPQLRLVLNKNPTVKERKTVR